jgi:hypothetical protein
LDVEGEKNNIVFFYTLQNNTDADYRLPDASTTLMAQLTQTKSLSSTSDGFTSRDTSVFIPTKQRVRYGVHIAYPYGEPRYNNNASDDERGKWRKKLAEFVHKDMANLNGFVLFDESNRFQINLPKGW